MEKGLLSLVIMFLLVPSLFAVAVAVVCAQVSLRLKDTFFIWIFNYGNAFVLFLPQSLIIHLVNFFHGMQSKFMSSVGKFYSESSDIYIYTNQAQAQSKIRTNKTLIISQKLTVLFTQLFLIIIINCFFPGFPGK